MKQEFDFIIVGSGINSLCCAALLTKKGHSVCVLERNNYLGGCIKTEELTLPGFRHDVLSGFHPLFVTSPTYQELAEDLARHGLEYVNTDKPTAVVTSSKESCILSTSREKNIKAFNKIMPGDGHGYAQTMNEMEQDAEFTFSLLGSELITFTTLNLFWKEFRKRKLTGLLEFFGEAMSSSRDWLEKYFKSNLLRSLFSPWVLHTGLGPDANFSGAMNRVIAFSLEAAGMPIVKGGSDKLVHAFKSLIEEMGGKLLVQSHVSKIVVEKGIAKGVLVTSGDCYAATGDMHACSQEQLYAKKAVICNVTPQQLYLDLIEDTWVPKKIRQQATEYKYGRGNMQIHLALNGLPEWGNSDLNDVAMVHLTDGIDSVAKAVNQAERGLLPDNGTVVVAQPTALDSSRAPEGKAILWIQIQELPSIIKGDAANEINIPKDGQWNKKIKERYADRIIERLAVHIPGIKEQILSRVVLSPADLQTMNINLVGGDPYSGHCGIQQFFVWRPLKSMKNHNTTVKDLYHIGASTHPGPGLGGNSGYMVAKSIA